jgi:hypothetical protein
MMRAEFGVERHTHAFQRRSTTFATKTQRIGKQSACAQVQTTHAITAEVKVGREAQGACILAE